MVYDMTYTLKVEQSEDTGEYYIVLPEELLKQMNWQQGDNIVWNNNEDGSFTLKKEDCNNTQTKGAVDSLTVNYGCL